ncbi:MAG: UDP-N-acetylmuramoyl-L-alanyl-D-glutamate--2,6-diaminopimelate ligase [Bryobacteraceae bacterium]
MKLESVLRGVRLRRALPAELAGLEVEDIDYDSRRIQPGALFFAFPGQRADGRCFAADALERGAVAAIGEGAPPEGFAGPWIEVEHGRHAMGLACRNLWGERVRSLRITGVTGTNGKTTSTFLLDTVLQAAGHLTALIGTVRHHVAGRALPAQNTTPESADLYRIFVQLAAQGGSHVIMEVSSHALALGRVYGIPFHCAVFTNLTQDHLDFHQTMENYFAAKQQLFTGEGAPPPAFAVVNRDDPYGAVLRLAPQTSLFSYGIEQPAAIRAENVRISPRGLEFDVLVGQGRFAVRSSLTGRFNVYNILAAWGAAQALGLAPEEITAGVEKCAAIPGRFERVELGQPFTVVVDYAHTEDALRNLIRAARDLGPRRVITLFGCGGDRDPGKRPKMGQVAATLSDVVVLTSDNPRSEDPQAILDQILAGIRGLDVPCVVEAGRKEAIRKALEMAGPGDIVLLAGKGHETYQILADRTIAFDDREAAREILRELGYGGAVA